MQYIYLLNDLCLITCWDWAHTTQLLNTSAVSPKSFKFPSGDYWILSKVSLGRLVLSAESHKWLYGSACHLGTVEKHEGWMVSYNKPLSSTSSSLSSSRWFPILPTLQPTSSLPAFQAAIFNADRATNQRHSSTRLWLFIPSKSCLPFLRLLLIVIRGTWHSVFHMKVWREELSFSA